MKNMKKLSIYNEIIILRTEGMKKYDNIYKAVVMNLQKKYEVNTTKKGEPRMYLPDLNTLNKNEWIDLFHIHMEALDICEKSK